MAAPAFGTISTLVTTNPVQGSFTVNVPASVASGDIILIMGQVEDLAETTAIPTLASTNFTNVFQNNAATAGHYTQFVLWKRATAGDTGTYTVTYTDNGSSYNATAHAIRITGGKSSGSPIDVSDHQQGTNATNYPNTSVTAKTDSLGVAFYGCFSSGTLTGPTAVGTWVQRWDGGGVGSTEYAIATQGTTSGGTLSATGASWSVSDGEMDSLLFTVIADTSTSNADLSVSTIGEPVVGGSTF